MSESFVFPDARAERSDDDDANEVDSLPSSSISSSDLDSEGRSDAQREWEASLQQLELLLSIVVVPYVGKYLGRRCAYWGWARYMEWLHPIQADSTALRPAAARVGAAAAL